MSLFLSVFIKFFFLLTPFFVLTMFLSLTKSLPARERRLTAVRVTLAVAVVTLVLFHFGNAIFEIFGITVDSFRIGAGALLFLSAVSLVRGRTGSDPEENQGDVAVVPLAIPIAVGPATTGALLVMGATMPAQDRLIGDGALMTAVLAMGVILFLSAHLQRLLGRMGIEILTKLTGLILSALAAQLIFTGIRNFLALG